MFFIVSITSQFGITTASPKIQGYSQKWPPDGHSRSLFFAVERFLHLAACCLGVVHQIYVWQAIPLEVSATQQTSFPPLKGSN
jgi:hypothetical protein